MTLVRFCDHAALLVRRQTPVRWVRRMTSNAAPSSAAETSTKRSIAVLGAGISGLTHALHLARSLDAKREYKIVVYESSNRLGGWVHSQRASVPNSSRHEEKTTEDDPLFEFGPRSIRASSTTPSWSMLELIASLDLSKELICIPKKQRAARSRLVYYNAQTHRMPNDIFSGFVWSWKKRHILYKAKVRSAVHNLLRRFRSDQFKYGKNTDKWQDESVEGLLANAVGEWKGKEQGDAHPFADFLLSPVFHGIYAADPSQLSARMTIPSVYNFLQLLVYDRSSWLPFPFALKFKNRFALAKQSDEKFLEFEVQRELLDAIESTSIQKSLGEPIVNFFKEMSILSFRNGLQTLIDAMHKECVERGVEFRMGSPITAVKLPDDGKKGAVVKTAKDEQAFHRVISALPSQSLDKMTQKTLPNLSFNPQATVAVVNIAAASHLKIKLAEAFGFLMPRISAKEGDNPAGLLGVVFDSSAVPGQDSCTKITMMFGGPYWRPGFTMYDAYTRKSDGKRKALELAVRLSRSVFPILFDMPAQFHLSDLPKGWHVALHVQRDCIPTYLPGHHGRMDELHEALSLPTTPSLSVIGASYTGVSVNDCVLYAKRTARRIVAAEQSNDRDANVSGLEELVGANLNLSMQERVSLGSSDN